MRGSFAATWISIVMAATAACSGGPERRANPQHGPTQRKVGSRTISIVGTNDLHGALERLPLLAGFFTNLRAARAADGGGVVLVDAGDMFQGTLESNIAEGSDIVKAYNVMGYAAAAVGNHEFDYGPEGPAVTAATIEDDARGALKARAAEASFPIMTANILDATSGARIKWPNMPPSTIVEVDGVKIGIIGASTESTPFTTMPANFLGLKMAPAARAIVEQAQVLRAGGATVIVVIAHIGSKCEKLGDPKDDSSCDHNEELYQVIGDLPHGTVDVIVAGHTHAGIANRISDIAVIESYSSGSAFGRVDLRVAADGHVTAAQIFQPQSVCGDVVTETQTPVAQCQAGPYEGKPVVADSAVQTIVDGALARAGERRSEALGVTVTMPIGKSYGSESAEGNLFTDLMLAARPEAQVAVTNGGGLRADLPAGQLTYGQLFEAMPFDNRFAVVDVKGSHLRKLVRSNLQRGGAILSWGGLAARARCKGGVLDVAITVQGKPLADETKYKLVTSDFLASGGDGLIGRLKLPEGSVVMTDVIIRDAMASILRGWIGTPRGTLEPAKLYSPKGAKPVVRMDYEGERPVHCGSASPSSSKPNGEPDE